jgi:hypothetical protein
MVTCTPAAPLGGTTVVMIGGTVTVKGVPVLDKPLTVTTTFPVVAPLGTVTMMLVALQLVGMATMPLNITVLPP